ncbi:uncharacterized protein LOC132637519 [Lycium barbarum]|uniref:uncharacterized protein LOC132625680 n=1 Tax=Lycium barbarum TaxID=112863 RepID=UPI00293EF03F|nr:uncharacterized protein LOC132625680 [Lycium barbarum]XP_060210580.1 uncharacterized protein LOC132637519 [Lycium barbarum]
MPSVDEVKNVVFNLSGSSASGLDGFVLGRSIIENVLLAEEIVTDIRKRGKPANVVIKLDMAKAYDRAKGFFHSTRGVKQGDPLSPALFVLPAEVLSRALNAVFDSAEYVGYGMPKWSQNINHLAYADANIIFAYAEGESLKRIMKILQYFEAISGQLINKDKCSFYMYQMIPGILRKKVYYNDLIKKVKNKLQNWKGKLLSFGGKAVLINTVLQSIPIYMLSDVVPTKYTINELHKIFARFYWSTKEEGKSRHWSSWGKMKPTEVQWKGGSQVWKRMIEARDQAMPPDFQVDTSIEEVSYFMNAEGWDVQKLHNKLPINVCDHVLKELSIVEHSTEKDKAC